MVVEEETVDTLVTNAPNGCRPHSIGTVPMTDTMADRVQKSVQKRIESGQRRVSVWVPTECVNNIKDIAYRMRWDRGLEEKLARDKLEA